MGDHDSATDTPIVYEAARLFDGTGFVEPARILVRGDRVEAVGTGAPTIPDVHLGDVTLLPGIVDCHQHLVLDGNGTLEEQVAPRTDDELRERARANARRALEGGVTTLRDLGDRGFVTLDLRDDPDLPTILCAGPPLTLVQGHCWYLGGEVADETALRAAVQERVDRGCDVVKVMATGGATTPTTPMWVSQFSADELRMVVDEAHRAGLPVAAHCHGAPGIADSIAAGVDTIEHCTFMNEQMFPDPPAELLDSLAASGIALSLTFGMCADAPPPPERFRSAIDQAFTAWTTLRTLGANIVVGSDAGINPGKPHDVAPEAIHPLLRLGMTPTQALAALTSGGADALGLASKGRLTPGADADMLAVHGDLRTDPVAITRIAQVWRGGRPVLA